MHSYRSYRQINKFQFVELVNRAKSHTFLLFLPTSTHLFTALRQKKALLRQCLFCARGLEGANCSAILRVRRRLGNIVEMCTKHSFPSFLLISFGRVGENSYQLFSPRLPISRAKSNLNGTVRENLGCFYPSRRLGMASTRRVEWNCRRRMASPKVH